MTLVLKKNGVFGVMLPRQAYIGIPPGHQCFGLSNDNDSYLYEPIVHGGITYGGESSEFDIYKFPEGYWVFGWSYCYFSSMDDLYNDISLGVKFTPSSVKKDVRKAMEDLAVE